MSKTVLFQAIQFSISSQFSSIWAIDRTLLSATNPAHCGPGNDGNEGILRIPQSSSITGALPSDCLESYLGHSLGLGVLPYMRVSVGVFYSASWLGQQITEVNIVSVA